MEIKFSNILDLFTWSTRDSKDSIISILESNFDFHHHTSMIEKYYWQISNNDGVNQKPELEKWIEVERERLAIKLNEPGNLAIHAPTSFGKSFLIIDKVIKSTEVSVIVTPTLSLATEYFMKIKELSKSKVVSMSPLIKEAEIYVLTPEKTMVLFERGLKPKMVVFDEFYEAFSGSHRFYIFDSVFNFAKNFQNCKIVTISPSKTNIPKKYQFDNTFDAKYSPTFRIFNKFLVDETIGTTSWYKYSDFDSSNTNDTIFREIDEKISIDSLIEKVIEKNKDKKILIISSKNEMYKKLGFLSKMYESYTNTGTISSFLIQYLEANTRDILLISAIKKGVAYHHGTVDKFVRTLIEWAFELGEIKCLLSSTTLTKGVNISPDILIVDKKISSNQVKREIRKIETLNAYGRCGRTSPNSTRVGKVYILRNKTKSISVDLECENFGKTSFEINVELKSPEMQVPKSINSIENAYNLMIMNMKNGDEFSLSDTQVSLIREYLKHSENTGEEEADHLYLDIAIMVCEKFSFVRENQDKNKSLFDAKIGIFVNFMYQKGYSKVYSQRREYYIKSGTFHINIKRGWASKEKKNEDYEVFVPNSWHEDLFLSNVIEEYENEAGFYFNQLLLKCVNYVIANKLVDETVILNFEKRQERLEAVATENGWPDSFADVFNHSGVKIPTNGFSTKKDTLNNLLKLKMLRKN